MAKSHTYCTWGRAAIAGGVVLTGIEVLGAVSYLASQESPSYLIAGGAVVTVVAAILPILAARCWRERRRLLACLLWLALVPALSLIFTAAVERTGGARDEANRGRQEVAQRIELARSTVADAKAVAASDEVAAKAECATGRGPKCRGLEARADKSRERLQAARTKLAQAGVVPTDPQARRIAAVLPVSEEAVQLYQPLILPLAISIIGLLLIAVGAHHPQKRRVQKGKGRKGQAKPKAKRKAAPKRKPKPKSLPDNVVPLKVATHRGSFAMH